MTLRTRAFTAGILIIAAYTSIAGLLTDSTALIVLSEATAGGEVILLAFLLYPLFRSTGAGISRAYLILKILEGGILIAAALLLLPGKGSLMNLRSILTDNHVFIFIPASALLYLLLMRTDLVPRFISFWGEGSLILLLAGNLLMKAGVEHPAVMLFFPLIMLNEFFLAFLLMIKGFNTTNLQGWSNGKKQQKQ